MALQDLRESLGFLIWHLSQAFNMRAERALAPLELTLSQSSALLALRAESGLSGADLARRCAVTPPAMGRAVDGLVRRGLIERRPHPVNRRIVQLHITAAGIAVAEQAATLLEPVEAEVLKGFSAEERDEARRLVARMVDGVSIHSLR